MALSALDMDNISFGRQTGTQETCRHVKILSHIHMCTYTHKAIK